MLFPLRSQFLKYDLFYFFYSGKAGKGWRKCWLSTILNTTRLLSLQTGARHALSVKYLWYTFLIFHNLPSSTLPGKVQTWQNKMKRQKLKNDRDKSGCFVDSLDLTNSEQCNHLQLWALLLLLLQLLLQWKPLRRLSDMQRPGHGRLISSCSFNGIKGAGYFGYFEYFKYFRWCASLTSIV